MLFRSGVSTCAYVALASNVFFTDVSPIYSPSKGLPSTPAKVLEFVNTEKIMIVIVSNMVLYIFDIDNESVDSLG